MKKRIFISVVLLFSLTVSLSAQAIDPSTITGTFNDVSQQFASALPSMSAIGLNWNDAYIGNFPHFGVGLSAGFASIPYAGLQAAIAGFGLDLASLGPAIQFLGIPLPAYALDARVGGFGIPFDVGLKFGFFPNELSSVLPAGVGLNYLLIGGDFRFGILEDKDWVPAVSVGAGVNYLSGGVRIAGATPALTIATASIFGAGNDTTIGAGDFDFGWQALTLELRAQASKQLAIFNLSVGFAASYSVYAVAHAGFLAPVTVGPGNTPISPAQIDALRSAYPAFDVSQTQFLVGGSVTGWALRAFGGFSINIAVVRLDISAMYSFLSGGLGATVNLRFQM